MKKQKQYKWKCILAIIIFLICIVAGLFYKAVTWKPDISESQKASEAVIRKITAKQVKGKSMGYMLWDYKNPHDLNDNDFVKIQTIDLSGSNLSDLKLLEKFANLKDLNLMRICFPKTKIPMFRNICAKLHLVNLTERNVFDLSPLRNLKNLQRLDLSSTKIEEIKPLAGLTNLEFLALDGTLVENIEPLANLINLKELYLTLSKVSDISSLSKLTSLNIIMLDDTKVENIQSVSEMINLESLILLGTKVSNIKPVKNLKNLKHIDLRKTKVRNIESLAALKNLESVFLGDTEISDIRPLANLTKLQELHIENCINIPDEQIEELQKVLPNLIISK